MSKKTIIKVIKIVLALALLTIIFSKIDFDKLWVAVQTLNLVYLVLGLLFGYVSQVFLGVLRWKYILKRIYGVEQSYFFLLRVWWIGMFVGYFVPGNIGMDVYRVVMLSRKEKTYALNISALLGEKIYGIIVSFLLLVVLYPFLTPLFDKSFPVVEYLNLAYYIGVVFLVVVIAFFTLSKVGFVKKTILFLKNKISQLFYGIASKINSEKLKNVDSTQILSYLSGFLKTDVSISILLQTILIRLLASVGGYLLFLSAGVELSLLTNIFATAFMFVVFMLPISFGSIGIREGTYIMFFALFGVEKEISLLMSFIGLICLVFTVSLGGVFLIFEKKSK